MQTKKHKRMIRQGEIVETKLLTPEQWKIVKQLLKDDFERIDKQYGKEIQQLSEDLTALLPQGVQPKFSEILKKLVVEQRLRYQTLAALAFSIALTHPIKSLDEANKSFHSEILLKIPFPAKDTLDNSTFNQFISLLEQAYSFHNIMPYLAAGYQSRK